MTIVVRIAISQAAFDAIARTLAMAGSIAASRSAAAARLASASAWLPSFAPLSLAEHADALEAILPEIIAENERLTTPKKRR